MRVLVHADVPTLGQSAAEEGAAGLRAAVERNGTAVAILATGASQFATLGHLLTLDVPWQKITIIHLDEYVGLDAKHPASFARYLWDRFVSKLPVPPKAFYPIDGTADPDAECRRLAGLTRGAAADVAFIGIGENAHLAFNDPPADLTTEEPYLVVSLDEACRKQQLGEGWFPTLADVPAQAITMSVKQILKSGLIVCSVPDARKAEAVRGAVKNKVSPACPATALQGHPNCTLHLDPPAAAKLG